MESSVDIWACSEFSPAKLGDTRLTRRLIAVAASFARTPSGKVTQAVVDPAEREAAYQFMENERVTGVAVARAAFAATADRCRGCPWVFVAVDGSSLRISDAPHERGTGPIGARNFEARGFQVMSALAVTPDGVPLGLCGQSWWARPEEKAARDCAKRKVDEKETRFWLETNQQVRASLAGTGCRPWLQLDRGGDAWPVLLDAEDQGSWITVRASHDRRLRAKPGEERDYLWPAVHRRAPIGHYRVHVPARPTQRERDAVLSVRAVEVTLDLQKVPSDARRPMRVWAVCGHETAESAGEDEPLEWMLLTTFPVATFEDACTVLYGYSQRWRIEEFHKAWKSGACNVEQTQLRSNRAIHVLAMILAAVATRLLRMTYLSRATPDVPATTEFRHDEIRAAAALVRRPKPRHPEKVTLGTVVRWIADAGGYTGKSSGGPPGFIVLGRGLAKLQAVTAANEPPEKDRRSSATLRWPQ